MGASAQAGGIRGGGVALRYLQGAGTPPRAAFPATGHLPATGVLSDLQKATKARDTARANLIILHAIGKDGPSGAHMIALGDSIRALKRLGMEKEARLLGLEALFPQWPRARRG